MANVLITILASLLLLVTLYMYTNQEKSRNASAVYALVFLGFAMIFVILFIS